MPLGRLASSETEIGLRKEFLSITVQFGAPYKWSGVEKFADLQSHGGVECRVSSLCAMQSSCGVQDDCHNFTPQCFYDAGCECAARCVSCDFRQRRRVQDDSYRQISSTLYQGPLASAQSPLPELRSSSESARPSGSRASFKRRQPPPPDRALKLVDSILIR